MLLRAEVALPSAGQAFESHQVSFEELLLVSRNQKAIICAAVSVFIFQKSLNCVQYSSKQRGAPG